MRKFAVISLVFALVFALTVSGFASSDTPEIPVVPTVASGIEPDAVSAVLMEAETGRVLYTKNEAEALPPASVTKIMTLLLVMEAIGSGKVKPDDMVTISENAASMGGSQVFLAAGEQFTVDELLKCTVIASANDAAVALAEHVYGSEASFVALMNRRAAELGMVSSSFENVTGLDDTVEKHLTSAMDIAIMSRKLISYEKILEYSSIWMDSIRDGAFGLTNTNRLVRYYPGATGLKTGSTAKAGFCISATAKRDGMTLICVIMGAPGRDARNLSAMRLLDYGFANYSLFKESSSGVTEVAVAGGVKDKLRTAREPFCSVLEKGKESTVKITVSLPDMVSSPIEKGDEIGQIKYSIEDTEIGTVPIIAAEKIDSISFLGMFLKMLQSFFNPT